jgi:hypothetical protein
MRRISEPERGKCFSRKKKSSIMGSFIKHYYGDK